MIDDSAQPIVTVTEGGGMDSYRAEMHLMEIDKELEMVSKSFGRVSLLINALEKEFSDLGGRIEWSKGIRNIPVDIEVHKVAFVVLPEDVETAKFNISDMPWAKYFLSVAEAKKWLIEEW